MTPKQIIQSKIEELRKCLKSKDVLPENPIRIVAKIEVLESLLPLMSDEPTNLTECTNIKDSESIKDVVAFPDYQQNSNYMRCPNCGVEFTFSLDNLKQEETK